MEETEVEIKSTLPNVVLPFYCNNEYNFIKRCSKTCDVCKDLQD